MTRRHPWWLASAASVLLLAACAGDPSDPRTGSTASADDADYVLLTDDDEDPDQVLGDPGSYALTARGTGGAPLAVVVVPAGYSSFGSFALVPVGFPDADVPLRSVQYWNVDGVFVDPCAMDDGAPDAGTSVEDLVAALQAQKRTGTTEPVPVSLEGHAGLYLELTAPADLALARCDLGYYGYWEGSPDDAQHTVDRPGTVDRVWVLDVDGDRVVLVAAAPPGVTAAQVRELSAIVESTHFVDADE